MTKTSKKTAAKPVKRNKTTARVAEATSTIKTKAAAVLALLEGKSGTTVSEIAIATGWQNHSVRGFLSGTVKKKLGRKIASEMVDGERRYRIAGSGTH